MKKIFCILVLVIFLSGCKTFEMGYKKGYEKGFLSGRLYQSVLHLKDVINKY